MWFENNSNRTGGGGGGEEEGRFFPPRLLLVCDSVWVCVKWPGFYVTGVHGFGFSFVLWDMGILGRFEMRMSAFFLAQDLALFSCSLSLSGGGLGSGSGWFKLGYIIIIIIIMYVWGSGKKRGGGLVLETVSREYR